MCNADKLVCEDEAGEDEFPKHLNLKHYLIRLISFTLCSLTPNINTII